MHVKPRTPLNELALVIGGNAEEKIILETKISCHFPEFSFQFVYLFKDQV